MIGEILSALSVNAELASAVPSILALVLPLLQSVNLSKCCEKSFEPIVSLLQSLIQDPIFIKQIIELIKTVHKAAKKQARERELAANKTAAKSRNIHHARCDNCQSIIRGIRYKCLVCEDFDLCEACEQLENIHNAAHNFVKIRAPLKGFTSAHSVSSPRSVFVRDVNIEDDSELVAGQSYAKKWAFRNTGLVTLPAGCKVKQISGDQLQVASIEPIACAQPGDEFEVTINLVAPQTGGNFKSTWILTDSQGAEFGDQFWIQFSVAQPALSTNDKSDKWEKEIALMRDMGFDTIDKDILEYYLDNFKGNMAAVLSSIIRQTK